MTVKIFPIVLTSQESLQTFTIGHGVQFKVELSEPCSAGYLWSEPVYDNTILNLISNAPIDNDKPFNIETCKIGAAVKRRFVFETRVVGISTIFASLKRPFEKNKLPLEVFSVSIRVI